MLPGLEPQEDPAQTWRVGELGAHLERLLAGAFPGDVWVEGQIRDLSRPASGLVFFQLAEPAPHGQTPTATVAVVLRRPEKVFVNNLLRRSGGAVRMDDGIEVRIKARVRWYRPRGVLQLQMLSIDPAFTLGRLAADRERTLAALREDGLLDANRRRPVPAVPLRIGLVTSLGSAAHADFLAELRTSELGFTVYEADARTQGMDCEPSVVAALAAVSRLDIDVVALVHGGGARTDLTGFDSNVIARAIAAMGVPVLTGIGHETDRSIADEVAHTAFKTPTAVADHLIDRVIEFRSRTSEVWEATARAAARRLDHATARLDERARRSAAAAGRSLVHQRQRVDALAPRTSSAAGRALDRHRSRVDRAGEVLTSVAPRHLTRADTEIDGIAARVRAHDPVVALRRGWSITRDADGEVVRTAVQAAGTTLVTDLADGTVTSEVVAHRLHSTAPDTSPAVPASIESSEEPT